MANVTTADIKTLREMTGAGILDCKKALMETDCNLDDAVTVLRKAGIAKAGKKANRAANEGLAATLIKGTSGALVQIGCETDFVAKTDKFIDYVNAITEKVAEKPTEGDYTKEFIESEKEALTNLIATIGENMQITKAVKWDSAGTCASYIHAGGKVAVLVDVEGEYSETLLKDLCMHIAAYSPQFVTEDQVDDAAIERERDVAASKAEGKPADIAEKIINGTIAKWKKSICLVNQPWIMDDKSTISKVAPNMTVKRFMRLQIGS